MKILRIKKVSTFFVGIMMMAILLLCCGSQVQAAQNEDYSASTDLSLGDSIAYGMSATAGNDYVHLFHSHILNTPTYSQLSLNNLAVSGDTSSKLLTRLQTAPYIAAVKNAKVITISIGGNNLLSPVSGAVCTAFGVNPLNNPNIISDLAAAMAANPNKDTIIAGLAHSPDLAQALQSGVNQFGTDFPRIIGTIKTLSPQAKIYVLNLYNPFNAQDPLYAVFDPLINIINQGISTTATVGYTVADVYTKFETTSGAVNYNLATMQLDPHPTTVGHAAIYQAILDTGSVPPDTTEMIEITTASSTVEPSKVWTIKLNGLVDEDSFKDQIYVTNSQWVKQVSTCTVTTDNGFSQIKVTPNASYSPDNYILWVKDIKTVTGTKLKSQVYLKFTVQ